MELARKIEAFASDEAFFRAAKVQAEDLAQQYSWDNMRPEYEKVLAG